MHFPHAKRFDAISSTNVFERGPRRLQQLLAEHNSTSQALQKYCRENKVLPSAMFLTISHCWVVEDLLSQDEVGLVLEDDATAYLWALSPIGNFDQFLHDHLQTKERPQALYLQRIINPVQYPPIRYSRILHDRVSETLPSYRATSLYGTEMGLGGTTAIAWQAGGMRRFLERHEERVEDLDKSQVRLSRSYGCPRYADCTLDFDLKSLGQTASVMPPLFGARISARSTIERASSRRLDNLRHLQGEISSIESALFLFESLSLMSVLQHLHTNGLSLGSPVEQLQLAFVSLTANYSHYTSLWKTMPQARWRCEELGETRLEDVFGDESNLVFACTFVILLLLGLIALVSIRLCRSWRMSRRMRNLSSIDDKGFLYRIFDTKKD